MFKESEYARLRALLPIDSQQIGEELVKHPQILLETLEYVVQASSRMEAYAADHKIAVTIEAAKIREVLVNNRKRAETEILAEALLCEEAQAALGTMQDAKADLSYWQALAESMRAKLSAMKRIAELVCSGYMTTGSAYAYPADSVAAARSARHDAEARRNAPPPRVRPTPTP